MYHHYFLDLLCFLFVFQLLIRIYVSSAMVEEYLMILAELSIYIIKQIYYPSLIVVYLFDTSAKANEKVLQWFFFIKTIHNIFVVTLRSFSLLFFEDVKFIFIVRWIVLSLDFLRSSIISRKYYLMFSLTNWREFLCNYNG